MEIIIFIILIVVVAAVVGVVAYEKGRKKHHEDVGYVDNISCTNPTCKRRKTAGEYLHDRLIEIGREAYERKYGLYKNITAVTEANKDAAESVEKFGADLEESNKIADKIVADKSPDEEQVRDLINKY